MSEVNSQVPESGAGFQRYGEPDHCWARHETVMALVTIARGWAADHPHGARIGIGEISLRGGGPIPGHVSHRDGLDVDLRPLRADGHETPVTITQKAYSRTLTQELVDRIWANGILPVATILFNDRKIAGSKYYPGHGNHLHVRFQLAMAAAQEGSRGPFVQQIQRRLNATGTGTPLLVDGNFGAVTTARLRVFQGAHGLTADGVAGPRTWAYLAQIEPWTR